MVTPPKPETPPPDRLHPWTRLALQGILLVLFGGLVIAILGVASAVVYWAWTA